MPRRSTVFLSTHLKKRFSTTRPIKGHAEEPVGVMESRSPSCFMISSICSGVDLAFSLAT
jgi:hypothetical protein